MPLTDANRDRWLRRFHPAGANDLRIICFPHAGGSAGFYLPFSEELSPSMEVLSVQYPGRQDRRTEPCIEDIPALAQQISRVLLPWVGESPLALFGHSMGAIVAFEVARLLQRSNTTPVRLFASGRRAPSCHRDERVHLSGTTGMIAELRRLNGTHSLFLEDDDLLSMILPVMRSDYKAVETYRHSPDSDRPELTCPITVLVGDNDPLTTLDEASAWSAHTQSTCDLQVFPGGHFYVNEHLNTIVNIVSDALLPHHCHADR
jgi:surfactin synthase thioesterase subunit